MKLISFQNAPESYNKWEFVLEYKGEQKIIILKEKADWPMISGEPVEKVEKWLFERQKSLCWLAFGIFS